jgi:Na+/H+-dicarboxylate symporter
VKFLKIKLHWQILIALFIAVFFGYFIPGGVRYVSWMGEIFLTALKMIIVPLIFSSIISGVVSIGGGKNLGRLGVKTMLYYVSTSLIAILTGLILVNIIRPGIGVDLSFTEPVEGLGENSVALYDILMRIVPSNIVEAMAKGDILPIIFFAILFGIFISHTAGKHKEVLTTFFDAFFEVMMKMTLFIIRFTPLGVFGIVAHEVHRNSGQLGTIAGSMLIYMLTVFLGLMIHAFVNLPLILRFVGRAKPYQHLKNMVSPLLMAFSTASSNATLPLTMETVENKSGVSSKITSFTIPLGATINMDGTALYECVAAIFIAQVYGVDMSFLQQILIVVTALLASIGAAGIPMAGLVMITIVLTAVGLPLEGVGLIIAVDRILDMTRTAVNVWSDTCGAVVIARTEKELTNVGR